MKTKLLILFSILTWNSAFSQRQHIIDSLQQALHRVDSDSAKYFLLNDLLREYLEYKNDSALYYSEQLIEMAERNNWKLALADGLDYKGYILMNLGKYAESYRTLMKGKNIAENPANEAFDRYSPSDRTPYKSRIYALANIHHELGHLMGKVNNREKQKFHYLKAEELAIEIGDEEMLGYVYMNLGGGYLRADNELDTALSMEMKALAIFSKQEDKKFMGTIHLNLGEIYERKKENKLALENFHKSMQIHKGVNHYQGMYLACSGLANFYLDGLNRDSSLYYSKKLGEIIRLYPTGLTENAIMQYHTFLYKSYELNNQRDSAYKHLTLAHSMQDSFHQQEIKNLTNVQNLSFEEQLRAEQLKKEKAALQSRIKQYALLGGLGVVLLVTFLLYRNNRQKQKSNAQLKAQNRELAIEAALDKIRRRTLLMKDSQELHEVVGVLFQEFKSLGMFPSEARTYFSDINEEAMVVDAWMTNADGTMKSKNHQVPLDRSPSLMRLYEAWKNHEPILVREYKGQELTDYLAFVASLPHVKNDEGYQQIFRNPPPQLYMTDAPFKQGTVGIMTFEPLTEEALEIQQRFAKVFEFTYTRFLDLKKAEAQAREAQIEAALERVRSRTMAMHKSEELSEVVQTLNLQFMSLRQDTVASWLSLVNIEANTMEIRTTSDGRLRPAYTVNGSDFPSFQYDIDEFKKGTDFWQFPIEKSATIAHLKKHFEIELDWPENVKEYHLLQMRHEYGFIGFGSWEKADNEAIEILKRFRKVFEQTYTRFLDLQKAEAQAREAQIEAALERVRAKAMAMHNSGDLLETGSILLSELNGLGVHPARVGFGEVDETTRIAYLYTNVKIGSGFTLQRVLSPKLVGHRILEGIFSHYKKQEEYFPVLKGKSLESYYQHLGQYTDIKAPPKGTVQYGLFMFVKDVGIYAWSEIPYSEDAINIYRRFTAVLGLTHQRYFDLKKAEAQAREAQIEAALERVRSRTIAMHKSDELAEVVAVIYQEVGKLGLADWGCNIQIFNEQENSAEIWISENLHDILPKPYYFRDVKHPDLLSQWDEWRNKTRQYTLSLKGESKKSYDDYVLTRTDFRLFPDKMKQGIRSFDQVHFNMAWMQYGFIVSINTAAALDKAQFDVLSRFAKVFEQTYTRFLDLQKAEARAKEARIEAGLERVRAEIASMRSREDLERITPLVWRELTTLEVPFFRCGVFIMDEENEVVHTYLSTPEGRSLSLLQLPFNSSGTTTRNAVEHWRKSEVYCDFWDRDQFTDWVKSLTEQGYVKEGKTYQGGDEPPKSLALQFVPFTQGMLYVGSSESLTTAQIALVQRLADTFAVAYARYEDFTKLEEAKNRIETTLTELKSTQTQLIQSEKLASLGELTAGIAHEIQNPLNFVNNFSELSVDLAEELKEEMGKEPVDRAFVEELLGDLAQNQQKINHHGKRAASIVTGMLQHARTSTGTKEPTDLNALADEYLRLSYHGLRAKDSTFNAKMVTDFDPSIGKVQVVPQDIGRVFLNIINNAFYATQLRKADLANFENLPNLTPYEPTVSISSKKENGQVVFKIKDNGTGIPEAVKEKIFQPFFTTKPTGQGTGLGLSLAYDIVTKGHGGTMEVETKDGEGLPALPTGQAGGQAGTEFIITLPFN